MKFMIPIRAISNFSTGTRLSSGLELFIEAVTQLAN